MLVDTTDRAMQVIEYPESSISLMIATIARKTAMLV